MNVTPARMRRGKDCLNPLERPPTVIKIGDDEYGADSSGVITLPNFQISIDDVLDEDSTNPVQNKVITLKIDDIIDSIDAIEDELGDAAIPGTVRGDIAGVNGRVDAIEDEIGSESDPGSILYKIHGNENDISGIQTHLDTVDGVIAAHATAINDKADKTTVNAIDNRLSTAETSLNNKADKSELQAPTITMTFNDNQHISSAWNSVLLNMTYTRGHNNTGAFTYGSNYIQVSKAGVYLITANIGMSNCGSGKEMAIQVKVGTVNEAIGERLDGTAYDQSRSGAYCCHLNANERIQVYLTGASTAPFIQYSSVNKISVTRIGD